MSNDYLEKVREPDQTVNPLLAFLGATVEEVGPDRAILRLVIGPELIQGAGVAAGGILATLLDEAMAHAVLAGNDSGEKTTTVDMNVSYLRPVNKGDVLVCESRVAKRGSRVVFAEAVLRSDSKEAARATGTFLVI